MICEKSSKNGKCSGGRFPAPLASAMTLLCATLPRATASRTEVTTMAVEDPDLTARSRPSGSGNIRWIQGLPEFQIDFNFLSQSKRLESMLLDFRWLLRAPCAGISNHLRMSYFLFEWLFSFPSAIFRSSWKRNRTTSEHQKTLS